MECQILYSESYEDAKWIHDNLYTFNLNKTGEERQEIVLAQDPERKTFLAVGPGGQRLGGCCWRVRKVDQFLLIDFLWLSDSARGSGGGSALIRAAEARAQLLGCCGIELGTNTFQAPGFYQKMGYKIFSGKKVPQKNYPENMHYIFRKIF